MTLGPAFSLLGPASHSCNPRAACDPFERPRRARLTAGAAGLRLRLKMNSGAKRANGVVKECGASTTEHSEAPPARLNATSIEG